MTDAPPRLWTIPPSAPFLETLAGALIEGRLGGGHALGDHLILLPTRRACRALTDTLAARTGDGVTVLPRIRPLGDIDEAELALDAEDAFATGEAGWRVPPAIAPLDRQLLLTRLVLAWGREVAQSLKVPGRDEPVAIPVRAGDAALLARDLARLLDDFETESRDVAVLGDLVPEDHAAYWRITLEFLAIATRQWPAMLVERGVIDPAARRDALLRAESQRLSARPPAHPVIVAGSTGTIPATAELIGTIARLPLGAVVLPGLDTSLDEEAWTAIDAADRPHPGHPQYGLKRLLVRIGAERSDVKPLTEGPRPARERFISELMRPAARTADWVRRADRLDNDALDAALERMALVEAADEQEQALAIALMLRETVADTGKTAALITPDRGLARRVSAELRRWKLALDDSAGTPLPDTRPGLVVRLIADVAASALAPAPLAALLHHPLALFGRAPDEGRNTAMALELLALRGPRPAPGSAGLLRVVDRALAEEAAYRVHPAIRRIGDDDRDAARDLARRIADALAPLEALAGAEDIPLGKLVAAQREALDRVCRRPDGSNGAFAGEAGAALETFLADLETAESGMLPLSLGEWPALLGILMSGRVVRPPGRGHPRIAILGPLEARLLSADRIILGGLDEGVWPADARTDPFLNRAMRASAGLEAPERFIGLAAHDASGLMAAPEVILTRAVKAGGAPTVASRWLQRLKAVAGKARHDALAARGARYIDWARCLDRSKTRETIAEPEPRPPVEARPDRLSITEIETLIRDPYAIYARRILRLEPLEPLDAAPGAAERGSLTHDALQYLAGEETDSPEATEAALIAIGERLFAQLDDFPEIKALWWPRFLRIARWFAAEDARLSAGTAKRLSELSGALELDIAGRPFRLTGRADRIDVMGDGALRILDYKTGGVPGGKEVETGLAPQLPLEAAMATAGAFADIPAGRPVAELVYVALTGREPPGLVRSVTAKNATPDDLAAAAIAGLERMLARFADPAEAYRVKTRVKQRRGATQYDHLSRFAEWSSAIDDED